MGRYRLALWWGVAGFLVTMLWVICGCNSSSSNTTSVTAVLNGVQEIPPVTTNATGTGRATFNNDSTIIDAIVTASGFTTPVTSVTLNYGAPGQAGPVMFILFTSAQAITFSGTASAQFTSLNLQVQPAGSPIVTFTDAANAIRSGNAYFNVRTQQFPSGEIRGQLNGTTFVSTLSGQSVIPSVTTSATGTGVVIVNNQNTNIGAGVTARGFASPVTQIQILSGAPGTNGPAIFTVFDSTVNGPFTGSVNTTLTSANLLTQPAGSPITDFTSAINAIRAGNTYFLVRTTNNPAGEIRGQITQLLTSVK